MAEKKEHHAVTQYVEGLQTLLASIRNDNDVAGGLWSQLKDAHQQFYHDSMLNFLLSAVGADGADDGGGKSLGG
jgi:hypothetical protein